jgi:hypothetical protein
MNKKNRITIVLTLGIAVFSLAVLSQTKLMKGVFSFESKVSAQTESADSNQVPSYVLYDQIFRMVITFKNKTRDQQFRGETVSSINNYFKEEANLNDAQNEVLEQAAADFAAEVKPIDDQARQIIAQIRQQFPDGIVPAGQEVPPPPAELANLQAQRNALAVTHWNNLSNALGSEAFESLDNFARQDFSQNFQAIGEAPLR